MGYSAFSAALRDRTGAEYLVSRPRLQCVHWLYMFVLTLSRACIAIALVFFLEICRILLMDGFLDALGYLKILAPPEKVLRWIEGKLNLLGRLPHYVSIDQKTYGRYGVLPTSTGPSLSGVGNGAVPMTYLGSSQRLGP